MLDTPFELLEFKRQHRNIPKDRVPVIIGYDTETVNGLCHLLASETDAVHPTCFLDIAQFLTQWKNRGSIGFFYNMRYDFQAILKWLPARHWKEVQEKGYTVFDRYQVNYIPQKMFSIKYLTDVSRKRGNRAYSFYDIAQFYGRGKLHTIAKKYLHSEGKHDISEHGFDVAHLTVEDMRHPVIIEYCLHDAYLCGSLARLWCRICNKMKIYPTNFCSPASISSRYFLSKTSIPTANRMFKGDSREYLRYAWQACSGAFITVFKRGYFDKVYEYDINSAYPFFMSQLPDIRCGTFIMSEGEPPDNAYLGWMHVDIEISMDDSCFYYPPIPMQRDRLCNFFPWGNFDTYITLKEYRHYREHFKIKPLSGVYWIPDYGFKMTFPFADVVNELYRIKSEAKGIDQNIYTFAKLALNGFYGKFLERHKERDKEHEKFGRYHTGNFYLPFYGSYILAGTRIAIFDALSKCPTNKIVSVSTDAIFSTQKIDLPVTSSLGEWDLVDTGKLLLIGCGVYCMVGKSIKQKTRGFKTRIVQEHEKNLFDYVKEQHKKQSLTIPITTNLAFGNALRQKRHNDMNLIYSETKDIYINFDTKRMWFNRFKTTGQLLEKNIDSYALPYGIL